MEGIVIRDMSVGDISLVYDADRLYYSVPWSDASFNYELNNSEAILQVAVEGSTIAGYVCIRTILDETHVMKLTVIPGYRRQGLGLSLLNNSIRKLKRKRPDVKKLTLEVRKSNIPAISLYEKMGFNVAGIRSKYYKGPDEDAVIMDLSIN